MPTTDTPPTAPCSKTRTGSARTSSTGTASSSRPRPLDYYVGALSAAGFDVPEVTERTIEAAVEDWYEFLAAYADAVLGWVGGSEKVDGRGATDEAAADRLRLLRSPGRRLRRPAHLRVLLDLHHRRAEISEWPQKRAPTLRGGPVSATSSAFLAAADDEVDREASAPESAPGRGVCSTRLARQQERLDERAATPADPEQCAGRILRPRRLRA